MQCNWLLDHLDFLYLSSPCCLYMHGVRESSWLSTIKVSANRELCCQYTAIVRSSRVLSYKWWQRWDQFVTGVWRDPREQR